MLVDYAEVTLLASSVFFAVIGFSLLYRYRQVSRRMNDSTDVARGLWQALDQRMRKQDERILDLMARFDVVQARVLAASTQRVLQEPAPLPVARAPEPLPEAKAPQPVIPPITPTVAPVPESQPRPLAVASQAALDETQVRAIQLLGQKEMNTRQITDALGKSREHTARIMKGLFEMGLVARDDSQKPFVYKLTDSGRARLPSS